MNVQIEESWKQQLTPEFEKDYFIRLTDFVRTEYHTTTIYPPGKLIFNAFNLCPFHQTKVVIIGRYADRRSVVKYSKVCYINGTADDNDLFVMANIDYQLDGTAQTYLFNNGNSDNFETMILDNCRLEMPADKKFIQTNGSREIDNIQIVNCDCKIGGGKEPWLIYTGAGDPLNLTLKNNVFWNADEVGMSAFQILYSKILSMQN